MKKVIALILASACMLNLAGCGNQTNTEVNESIKKEDVTVCEYSFNGENEAFSISNGHISINKISRFVGGTVEVLDQKIFEDVTSYSEKYYVISNGEKHLLLSSTTTNATGTTDYRTGIGEISSEELFANVDEEDLMNNLWYELETVSSDGEEQSYVLQLNVTKMGK